MYRLPGTGPIYLVAFLLLIHFINSLFRYVSTIVAPDHSVAPLLPLTNPQASDHGSRQGSLNCDLRSL